MTQRNPMNERYNSDKPKGKTRKSAASAKPKATRAATLRDPAPKTKKQKKEEAKAREREAMAKADAAGTRYESTEGYKRLRRIWWIMLALAIVCTALSFLFQRIDGMSQVSIVVMVSAYVFIIAAFYIDFAKIRKERKMYGTTMAHDKSKAARSEQKRLRAEQREQQKEAAEKLEAAQAEKEEKAAKRKSGLAGLFGKKKSAEEPAGENEPSGENDSSGDNEPAGEKA